MKATKTPSNKRDIEKNYPRPDFIAKLRRLADALEAGEPFTIAVAGERLRIPAAAHFNIEHERASGLDELEFQLKWRQRGRTTPRRLNSRGRHYPHMAVGNQTTHER